jgi:hypothetical protein
MLHAFAAALAHRLGQRFGAERGNDGVIPAVRKVDGAYSHDLVAPADTFPAENALIGIEIEGRVGRIQRPDLFCPAKPLHRFLLHPDMPGDPEEFALRTLVADETLFGMIGYRELDDGPPDSPDFLCFRLNGHAFLYGCCAGSGKTPHAFYLNDAQTARPERLQGWIVTKGRNIKTCVPDCFQDSGPLRHRYRPAINSEIDLPQGCHLLILPFGETERTLCGVHLVGALYITPLWRISRVCA